MESIFTGNHVKGEADLALKKQTIVFPFDRIDIFLTEREIKIYCEKVVYLHLSSKTEIILHIHRPVLQEFIQ